MSVEQDVEVSDEDKALGQRIRDIRKSHKMTQAQFAELCGIKSASQHLYEKGKRLPNASYLRRLSELGVDLNFLFNGVSGFEVRRINEAVIRKAYASSDRKCRDNMGRLFDLEVRVSVFIDELRRLTRVYEEKSPE